MSTIPPSKYALNKITGDASPGGLGQAQASSARVVMDDEQIQRALRRIAHELAERIDAQDQLYLVAIPNGGVPLARKIAENLLEIAQREVRVGILDTTLYRDDLLSAERGVRPSIKLTEMPGPVDGYVTVLVDDVISTGRTIRAAMDALMDFGRPNSIQVAVLVDRGHRELPIKIDYVGKNMPTGGDEALELRVASSADGIVMEVVVVPVANVEVKA